MAESVERIRRHIKAYQAEQEANLLKASGIISSINGVNAGAGRPMKMVQNTGGMTMMKGKGGRDDNPLAKYLDVDCFLLSGSASSSSNRSSSSVYVGKVPNILWPITLVAQLGEKYADLGHLETHGSLWRVLKIDNGMSIQNAYVLQSSEIGEAPLYLTGELELADTAEKAARWNIQVLPASKRESSYGSDDNMQGLFDSFVSYSSMSFHDISLHFLQGFLSR
jgi:hypothetical protein